MLESFSCEVYGVVAFVVLFHLYEYVEYRAFGFLWYTVEKGWRVGRNPPFVFCGIRLIGLPALPVDSSSASVCPFHLQDGRFTVSRWAFSTT